MTIQKAQPSDAESLSQLIQKTIRMYSKNQELLDRFSVDHLKKYITEREVFVYASDDTIFGTVTLKGNVVLALFVDPDLQGKGIGTELMAYVEQEAKQREIAELHVLAREEVVGFYESLGYEVLEQRVGPAGGVVVDMVKRLS